MLCCVVRKIEGIYMMMMFLRHITSILLPFGLPCLGWSPLGLHRHIIYTHRRSGDGGRMLLPSMQGHQSSQEDDDLQVPSQAESDILQLVQSHFSSQALVTAVRLGVLDVLMEQVEDENDASLTVDGIIAKTSSSSSSSNNDVINRDALFRCLRLLCTTGVVHEVVNNLNESAFVLTEMGRLLQSPTSTAESMSPFILHWAEEPLWNAWLKLPDYVAGRTSNTSDDRTMPPFDRANDGMSASEYYKNNAESCSYRNAVARQASSREIGSILDAMQSSSILNESCLDGKIIVDVGGGYGDMMYAMKQSMPSIGDCYCLDLPEVIDDAMLADSNGGKIQEKKDDVILAPGNMFDASSIPPCDIICTKHLLCDFDDGYVIRALQSFHKVLSAGGKVIIMDAV